MRQPGILAIVLLTALPNAVRALGPVAINEIHYHPPSWGAKSLEFVELVNTSAQAVSLAGWTLAGGVRFSFPAAASIPAGGLAVVCRDRAALAEHFALDGSGLFGDFDGALDNDSDEVLLLDAFRAVVDLVRYYDDAPWPEGADGSAASLERRCPSEPSRYSDNWSAPPGAPPTPLAPNAAAACPLPAFTPPAVVLSEVHYHPADDPETGAETDHIEEFVEVHNPGGAEVDLSGWTLRGGIQFAFPQGRRLAPGEHLVIARNQVFLRERLGLDGIIGDFSGELANDSDAIVLVNGTGSVVDGVHYRDAGEWPYGADGEGRSLERISPALRGDDPANWASSRFCSGSFSRAVAAGPVGPFGTRRLVLGINGPGELTVDNVLLARADDPARNLLPNPGFEAGLAPWVASGNARGSSVEPEIGVDGTMGLRLVSTGSCDAGCLCSSSQSVSYTFPPGSLDTGVDHVLSVEYRCVSGSASLYVRVFEGPSICLEASLSALSTPGRSNSASRADPPPHIWGLSRFPEEPRSNGSVSVTANVESAAGAPLRTVVLTYAAGETDASLPMSDDGLHGDAFAGDGVWGAVLPPLPHNTAVRLRIVAEDSRGAAGISPHILDDGVVRPNEHWGYYVNDNQPDSRLPVLQLILPEVDETDPEDINRELNCRFLKKGAFAHRGELYPDIDIRLRGNTACALEKTNLKLRFRRDRPFRSARKVNLQGLWTDKSFVREHLAWSFIGEIGAPYCETEYVRVHLNGLHHGLFLCLEHPDERFLERNGLDPDGCLYKASQPPSGARGVRDFGDCSAYPAAWEEETCEDMDYSDICEFVDGLHADGNGPEGSTALFHLTRVIPEQLIGYQLAQSVLNNVDSASKNHFLYRDTRTDAWGFITWDMDLVFGKRFSNALRAAGVVGTLNDCMRDPIPELDPWYATSIDNDLRNHFVDFFFTAERGFFQRAYLVRLWDILEEKYRSEVYDPTIDELDAFLSQEVEEDFARWGSLREVHCLDDCPTCVREIDMRSNLEVVKSELRLQRDFLRDYVSRNHGEVVDHDRMKITEVFYNPAGAGDSERLEFIEVLNTSGRRIDISGWKFAEGVEYTFPAGASVGADELILVVRSRAAFRQAFPEVAERRQVFGDYVCRLRNEGERLRLVDAGPGYPATVDFLDYRDGAPWPDTREGHSIEWTRAAPLRDNDRPENWAASIIPGGTPGSLGGRFVRGDADSDSRLSVGDAVRVLLFLIHGSGPELCSDAFDADDDGAVTLADPIRILNFLFRGGEPVPGPFPEAGSDTTVDDLSCP